MKKLLLLVSFFTCNMLLAQVGINNQDPKSTLDVTGKITDVLIPDGIIAPRLSGNQIQAKDAAYTTLQEGAIVYATSAVTVPGGTKTGNITSADYYFFDGTKWIRFGAYIKAAMPKFFYMPSIAMPTSASQFVTGDGFSISGATFSVNLYTRYASQFGSPKTSNATRTTTLPVLAANELDYYITSADEAVFENVVVTNAGVLTYTIKVGAQVTSATFMNIVFAVKP